MSDIFAQLYPELFSEKPNAPGIISDIKRGAGQVISSVGSTLQDVGAEDLGSDIESYGEGVTRRNPSQINTVEEALKSPFTTAREAVGEVVPQVGVSAAFGMGGRVLGGAIGTAIAPGVGTAIGQNIGAGIGAFAGNLIQEYGGIRSEQRASGQNDIARAIAAGSGAAILDTALGAERVANKVLGQGTSFLAREAGEKIIPHALKQGGRGLLEEAGTEFLQTGIERVGAFKDLTSEDALNEMGLSAIKGGIGGGVVRGGMASIAGERTVPGSIISDANASNRTGSVEGDNLQQAININPGLGLSTQEVVNQAIDIDQRTKQQAAVEHKARMEDLKAAFDEPTGIRVTDPKTGLERELTAFELYQQQSGGQAAEVAANAQKTQEMNQARADVFNKYDGITANRSSGGTSYSFLGKVYHTEQELNSALDKVAMVEQAKTPVQRQLENAYIKVNKMLGGKPLTPSSILSSTKLWNQLPTVDDIVEALDLQIQHDIPKTKNQSSLAKLEQLHVLRDELAGVPEDKRIPTVDLLPKEEAKLVKQEAKAPATPLANQPTQQTEGVSNERLQLQQQGYAGLRTVSEQGGAGQTSTGAVGDVRPTSVQSIEPTSVGAGQISQQVGAVPGEGISTSTGTNVTGANPTNASAQAQGQVNEQGPIQATGEKGQGTVSGQANQGSGDTAETAQDRAEKLVSQVVDSIVDAVVKRTGRMTNANLSKLKEFIYYDFFQIQTKEKEGIPVKDLAEMYKVSEDTIDGWRDIAGAFYEENRGTIQAQLYAAIDREGISFTELKEDLQAVRNSVQNEVTILEEGQALAEVEREDEEAVKSEVKETAATDQELTSEEGVLDERDLAGDNVGMSINTGRVQGSIQEQNKPEETINARITKLLAKYNEAIEDGNEELEAKLMAEIDTLTKEAKKVDSKRVAKSKAIAEEKTPKKEKKNAVQVESTDEGNVRKPARRRKKVGEGNAKSESTTGKVELNLTEEEKRQNEVEAKELADKKKYEARQKEIEAEEKELRAYFSDEGVDNENAYPLKMGDEGYWSRMLASQENAYEQRKQELEDKLKKEGTSLVAVKEEAAWNALPVPISYEQLTAAAKADWSISVEKGKTNLAAANAVYEEHQEKIQQKIADDSKTIDGKDLITEVGEEKQRLLLADQTSKLTEAQNERLEKHYGVKRDSEEFFQKLREDVLKYVNKGAEAVAGAIRDIVKQIANGVMAVAIILNPQFMGQQVKVAIPTNTTEIVQAKVPTAIDSKMSKAGKKAYATLMPALQKEMKEKNKYFTIVDKPTSTMFVFNPDGTLLDARIVVLGKAFGDFYVGQTDFVKNRITPGGNFIAKAEKGSATYDGKTVYTIGNEAEGWNVVFMHPVYLKESDAQARRDALASGKNTRLSHGCVNGPLDLMAKIDNSKMDGSHVFIVPDDQAKVDDFISNKISNEDLTRVTIAPVTKSAPAKTVMAMAGQSIFGKEETVVITKEPKDVKLSKKNKGLNDTWDSDSLKQKLKDIFGSYRNFEKVVTVVDSFEQLPPEIQAAIKEENKDAQGAAIGRRVYLIANNISIGQELPVFLHELGAHIGMENLLGPANYRRLTEQIKKWSEQKNNTLESKLAKKALERVTEAKVKAEDHLDELLAYFVEEAVAQGVRPTAMGNHPALTAWFRTLVAAMKLALRKIGFGKFDALTANNIVDLAFGAAKLELSGTYHGSATKFDKFLTKYIGTGEGAVAFGWGLYMAERYGTANDYMVSDLKRKKEAAGYTFKGFTANQIQSAKFKPEAQFVKKAVLDVLYRAKKDNEAFGVDASFSDYISLLIAERERTMANETDKGLIAGDKAIIEALKGLDPAGFEAGPARPGVVYRTLPMVDERKLLDLDKPLSQQPEILELLQKRLPEDVKQDLLEESNLDLDDYDMTGKMLQDGLVLLENKGVTGLFFALPESVIDTIKQGKFMSKQIVSEYLRMLGIEGSTYLDQGSRGALTEDEQSRNLVLFSNNAINKIASYEGANKEKVRFSFASKQQRAAVMEKALDYIDTLPKSMRAPVRGIHNALFNIKETMLSTMITEDVEDLAKKYMPAVEDYRKVEWERTGIISQYTDRLDKNMLAAQEDLDEKTRETVNRLLEDSTISGKWAYDPKLKNAKIDAELARRFQALPAKAQAVFKEVFATGNALLVATQDAINEQIAKLPAEDQKSVRRQFSTILDMNKDAPYAPLKRFGDFVVTAKSAEYIKAEANKDTKEMEKLQGDAKHYVVEFADTIGEALEMKRVLDKAGVYQEVKEPFKKSVYKDQLYSGTDLYKGFAKLKKVIEGQRGVEGTETLNRLSQMVNELYLMSLAESSARKSELHRKGIAGINRAMGETFARDMLRAAFTQGAASAKFIAGIKTNDKAMDAMIAMQKQASGNEAKAYPYLNEIMAREAQALQTRERSMLDTANRMTADWFLTFSPSFYFQQATQSYVLSLPWLAGKFGEGKSFVAMTNAYKQILPLVKNMSIREHLDFTKAPADVREMLNTLVARGRINIGTDVELHGYRSESANPVSKTYSTVTNKLRGTLNRIEALNRSTAAIAAYRLEMEKSGDKEKALKAADDVVRQTHGLYDGSNTPRLFNKNAITRSLFQFRRFQVIQATMLFKMMGNAVQKGNSKEAIEERAVARKQLMFMVGHSLALAGMKGVPFYGIMSILYGLSKAAFGDDKDPEDFEEWLRKHGGVLLARGIPAWMGVDVSGKVGMGNVFSVLPYTDVDLTSKKGYEKALVAAAGPFLGGLMPKMIDSVDMVAKGDYYKGLENALPNGINNVMKTYRMANEGITLRNGDTVMTPAELGFADLVSQLVGMPSTTITERQYAQGVVSRTDQYFNQEAKDIKHDYTRAFKEKDSAGMAAARAEWKKLQDARAKQGYKIQPLSDLIKAPQAQLKRERSVIGGVETNKSNKLAVRKLMES